MRHLLRELNFAVLCFLPGGLVCRVPVIFLACFFVFLSFFFVFFSLRSPVALDLLRLRFSKDGDTCLRLNVAVFLRVGGKALARGSVSYTHLTLPTKA